MGAYLSEPMTQKQSEDGEGNKLKFGACSMQGWRVSQEDAHNCIASFDDSSSLFAVYDGHGGAEVAIYLSKHLPNMLKACVSYKSGEFEKALEECYLKIDASLKTPDVLKEIQQLAKTCNKGQHEDVEGCADYEEENVGQLYEEATMPLAKLVAKYSAAGSGEEGAAEEEDPSCKPGSSKSISFVAASSSSSSSSPAGSSKAGGSGSSAAAGSGSSSSTNSAGTAGVKVNGESSAGESSADPSSSSSPSEQETKTETKEEAPSNDLELIVEGKKIELEIPKDEVPEVKKAEAEDKPESSSASPAVNGNSSAETEVISENGEKSKQESESNKSSEENGTAAEKPTAVVAPVVNGDDSSSNNTNGENTEKVASSESSSATTPESGTPRRKKVHPVPMAIPEDAKEKRSSPRKSAQFANEAGYGCSDSEDSDEDDAGYKMGDNDSDDSSDLDEDDSDMDDDEEDEDDDDDDDEDDDDDDEEEEDDKFLSDLQEPCFDSGATAVVCFMKWVSDGLALWVANAGDSRCVVCRDGLAHEMSHDHKPELDVETKRIVKAGGRVTDDGRVNGGLNLSRALGDHSYKQNPDLPPEEQMISPMPTVNHLLLDPKRDQFMVLACDGIWNSMSSLEVVEFVKKRLDKKESLSKICEELFDSCLASDTYGDGTGCDNMTCIIVLISPTPEVYSGTKRKLDTSENVLPDAAPDALQADCKKTKLGGADSDI